MIALIADIITEYTPNSTSTVLTHPNISAKSMLRLPD
jgi:hypothetical protein